MSQRTVGWYSGGCSRWRSEISFGIDWEIEEVCFVEILDFEGLYCVEYLEWWGRLAVEAEMYEMLSGM